jgi:uncharacterized protein
LPKAVVDTHLFVSGLISARGRPGPLLDVWRAGRFELLFSDQQYTELRNVVGRPKIVQHYGFSQAAIGELFGALDNATRVTPMFPIPVFVRDPKDEHILASARGGGADFLVTVDNDLLVLRDDPRLGTLRIATAGEFLEVLESSTNDA